MGGEGEPSGQRKQGGFSVFPSQPPSVTVSSGKEGELFNLPPRPEALMTRLRVWQQAIFERIHSLEIKPETECNGDQEFVFGDFAISRMSLDDRPFEGFQEGERIVQVSLNFPRGADLEVDERERLLEALNLFEKKLSAVMQAGLIPVDFKSSSMFKRINRLRKLLSSPEAYLNLIQLNVLNFQTPMDA